MKIKRLDPVRILCMAKRTGESSSCTDPATHTLNDVYICSNCLIDYLRGELDEALKDIYLAHDIDYECRQGHCVCKFCEAYRSKER